MAPNSTCVVSGKMSAWSVTRQPAGRLWISSCGCDHLPGMRRATVIGVAGSFILNMLLAFLDGGRSAFHVQGDILNRFTHGDGQNDPSAFERRTEAPPLSYP